MSYTVIIKESAQKQIIKLPAVYLKKVKTAIPGLQNSHGHMAIKNLLAPLTYTEYEWALQNCLRNSR